MSVLQYLVFPNKILILFWFVGVPKFKKILILSMSYFKTSSPLAWPIIILIEVVNTQFLVFNDNLIYLQLLSSNVRWWTWTFIHNIIKVGCQVFIEKLLEIFYRNVWKYNKTILHPTLLCKKMSPFSCSVAVFYWAKKIHVFLVHDFGKSSSWKILKYLHFPTPNALSITNLK
jgi:hypothetical protein